MQPKIWILRPLSIPLHMQFRTERHNILGYGVMVTLQILVLSFLVRVQVSQQKRIVFDSLFLFHRVSVNRCITYSKKDKIEKFVLCQSFL